MNDTGKFDYDAVAHAQATLLSTGRVNVRRRIGAYRVLVEAAMPAYLPKLAEALLELGYQVPRDRPQNALPVWAEAVEIARRIEHTVPGRTQLLRRALDAYQRDLYRVGDQAAGFAIRQEMAGVGTEAFASGSVDSPVYMHARLADAYAEEGRHDAAAEIYGRIVAAERSREGTDASFWSILAWSAQLDAAGQPDAAIDALTELVTASGAKLEEGRSSLAIMVWELVHLSRMLDARERQTEARGARAEAGKLLAELADSGERKSWSNIMNWWLVLFSLSGACEEPTRPGSPIAPLYLSLGWSPDLRRSFLDERAALERESARLAALVELEPGTYLPELMIVHRRVTIRAAIKQNGHHYRFLENLRPLFDDSVTFAQRLADQGSDRCALVLARALTDRAMLLVAGKSYSEALGDFRAAITALSS